MELAEETQMFMDSVMWNETGKGYMSLVNATGGVIDGSYSAVANLLAVYNLNVMYLAELSFAEFYSQYITNTIIALVVIVVIIWILVRGGLSFGGGKISKEVKGLL